MTEADFGWKAMAMRLPLTLCSHVQNSDHHSFRGGYLGTFQKWAAFSPKRRHCIEPIRSGVRCSVVLFTPGRVTSLTPSQKAGLKSLGFLDVDHSVSMAGGHSMKSDMSTFDPAFIFDPGDMD